MFSQLLQSWNNLHDAEKSRRFIWAVIGSVLALYAYGAWRFYIGGDYTLGVLGACDPRTEICFMKVSEPSCDTAVEECASEAIPEKVYYAKVWRRVHSIATCNPDEQSCREQFSCQPGEEAVCETEYCNPTVEIAEGEDRCSDATDVAELEGTSTLETKEAEEVVSNDGEMANDVESTESK